MKPLHELIEASEPIEKINAIEIVQNHSWLIINGDHEIEQMKAMIDRASYDRMKQIAVELAKELDNYVSFFDQDSDSSGRRLISKCRELLGEK